MIDNNLAKELKNAGWEFEKHYEGNPDKTCYYCNKRVIEIDGKNFYEPIMEELIEACLELKPRSVVMAKLWLALNEKKSPLKCVARLWLQLNKRN